jgi:hypothetical protein
VTATLPVVTLPRYAGVHGDSEVADKLTDRLRATEAALASAQHVLPAAAWPSAEHRLIRAPRSWQLNEGHNLASAEECAPRHTGIQRFVRGPESPRVLGSQSVE